jgi:hypothetical protein
LFDRYCTQKSNLLLRLYFLFQIDTTIVDDKNISYIYLRLLKMFYLWKLWCTWDFVSSKWISKYFFSLFISIVWKCECSSNFKLPLFHQINEICLISFFIKNLIFDTRHFNELKTELS